MSKAADRRAAFLQKAEQIGKEAHGSIAISPALEPSQPQEEAVQTQEPEDDSGFSFEAPARRKKNLRGMGYVSYSTTVDEVVLRKFKRLAFELNLEYSVMTTLAFSLLIDEQTRPAAAEAYFQRLRKD